MTKSTSIVLESDIKNIEEIYPVLKQYSTTYSNISRILFNFLKDKDNPQSFCNQLQKEYIQKYNIHARLFKSIWKMVTGKIQAIKSNQKNYKTNRKAIIKELENKLKSTKDLKQKFHFQSKINKLSLIDNQEDKVNSVWGSKTFYKKQWNAEDHDIWLEDWKIKRDNNIMIVGSHDETFGNNLCQLQTLQNLRLTLPKDFTDKHLNIQVDFNKDKKIYQYLKNAIAQKKALTFRIFQNIKKKKWYVQVTFELSNECVDFDNGTIGIDINYNLISTCVIKKDGNPEKFIDYRFNVNEQNKDKNRQELSLIVNQIVDKALKHKKTITIEKIDLKNVKKYHKVNLVCYNQFISLLKTRCIKMGILILEINPAYTSVIGKIKYSKRLGRSRHASASFVIGRRGLKCIERIPSEHICLLQGGERDKSLLTRWGFLNKRLQKVPKKESLGIIVVSEDQTTCNLNRTLFRSECV